jgi:hypothetical protein
MGLSRLWGWWGVVGEAHVFECVETGAPVGNGKRGEEGTEFGYGGCRKGKKSRGEGQGRV